MSKKKVLENGYELHNIGVMWFLMKGEQQICMSLWEEDCMDKYNEILNYD